MSSPTPPPVLDGPARPVDAAVADYLAAVGQNLAGIPAVERQDILEEVAEHLADVAAELGPDADGDRTRGPPRPGEGVRRRAPRRRRL